MSTQTLLYQVGTLLAGRFELVDVLGQGATGVVYRAFDREIMNQEVAVKVLYPHLISRPEMVDRFRNEVRIARDLTHAHIVKIYEWGSEGDRHFLVMEYVRGVSLRALLDGQPGGRLPLGDAVRILYEIADAVASAHRLGVVHRDLKPDNVIVGADGHVKVLDFGVARMLEDDRGLTQTGESIGTPWYMSPEQFRGDDACPQSDIYSFGIIAYELVSGIKPFDEQVFYMLALRHLNDELPPFAPELGLPGWYVAMIRAATSKQREERSESMEDIASLLAERLDEGTLRGHAELVRSWRAAEKARARRARRRTWRRSGSVTLLYLLLFFIGYWIFCMNNVRQWTIVGTALIRMERVLGGWPVAPLKYMFALRIPEASDRVLHAILAENRAAVEAGNAEQLQLTAARAQMLLFAGVGIDSTVPPLDMHILEYLTEVGPPNFVGELIARGVDPNVRTITGEPIASRALNLDRAEVIPALLTDPRYDPSLADRSGNTAFHAAARSGSTVGLGLLARVMTGQQLNFKNADGDTGMHLLARTALTAQPVRIRAFAAHEGIDIDIRNNAGLTPLDIAIMYDQTDNAEALLAGGVGGRLTAERFRQLLATAHARNNAVLVNALERYRPVERTP